MDNNIDNKNLDKNKDHKKELKKNKNMLNHIHVNNLNQRILFKIIISAIFLIISIGFSLIEIHFPLPWGVDFDLRIFDTICIALVASTLGFEYGLLVGFIQPWLHVAIDGAHSPISMCFYMFSNAIVVISFGLLRLNFFDIRKIKDKKARIIKYIMLSVFIIPFCSLAESSSLIISSKIMMLNIHYSSHSDIIKGLFEGNNVWIGLAIFFGVFCLKYIFVNFIFYIFSQRILHILEHYNLI